MLFAHARRAGLGGGKRLQQRALSTEADTVIYSWGKGSNGQLGHARFALQTGILEDSYIQAEPRRMVKSGRFKQCAVGDTFTLGLTSSDDLYGWGKDFAGDVESKEPAPMGVKASMVAAGPRHSALIDLQGQVHTWGYNGSWMSGGGQLGNGSRQKSDKPVLVEAFSALGTKAKWVSCGHQHTVILTAEGVVLSCGAGEYGVLGTGSTEDSTVPAPLDALLDEDIVHIAAGYDHTLALTATGKIYSWGRNGSGQLGHSDSFIDIYSMEDFPRLIDTESVKGGAENEDALRAAGLLNDKYVTFAQIAAGQSISAAITTEGLLFVWGARVGHQPKLIAPALLDNLRVKKVACGGGQRGSAFAILTEDGSLWMMGDSASKLLGVTGVRGKQPVPQKIPSLGDRVVDMSCGYGNHMVAFAKMVTTDT